MTDYPWFESTSQRLLQLVNQKKVPHAILFYGPKGLGEDALLQEFAQLLLCSCIETAGVERKKACGVCRSCYLFQKQHHPDLRSYGKENISIDDIREINHFLGQTSHQGGKKVVILWQIEKLSLGQSNALLKTLEEPSGESVLLLVAHSFNILSTIKSRCLLMRLAVPSSQLVMSWLASCYPQLEDSLLRQSLLFAGGIPLEALQLIQSGLIPQKALYQALLTGNVCAFDNEEIQQFITLAPLAALYSLYYCLVDFIHHALNCSTSFLYNNEQQKQLNQLLQTISLKQLFTYLENVNEAIRALSLPGINKSLLFCALLSQWHTLRCKGKNEYDIT